MGQAIDNNMAAVALSFVEEGFSMEMEYQKVREMQPIFKKY